MKPFAVKSPAKLNLYLAIGAKREDGYHHIETVFHKVTFGDSISLRFHGGGGISFRSNKSFLPADSRNLAVKAAEAFFQASGVKNTGLYINVKKEIPVGGGMAGGSTNAAAVLSALNQMTGSLLTFDRLMEVGGSLGADVPFCMMSSPAALGRGTGEVLTALPSLPPCYIVCAKVHVSISTKTAYQLFDDMTAKPANPPVSHIIEGLNEGDLSKICAGLYNDFEIPIFEKWPVLAQIKEELLSCGAAGALMTGSGSVVFGIFDDKDKAEKACWALRKSVKEVFLTTPE